MISILPASKTNENFFGETDKSRDRMGLAGCFFWCFFACHCGVYIYFFYLRFTSFSIDKICYDNFDCLAYHSNESWACEYVRVCDFLSVSLNTVFIHLYDNQHVNGKQIAMSKLNWLFQCVNTCRWEKTSTVYYCHTFTLLLSDLAYFVCGLVSSTLCDTWNS